MGPLTAVGTGVTVLGLGANVAGEQYLSSATAKAAQLDIAAQELELHERHLDGVRSRTEELSQAMDRTVAAADEALHALEKVTLDHAEAEEQFARTVQLVAAVSEIIRTRIVDDLGPSADSADQPRADLDQGPKPEETDRR